MYSNRPKIIKKFNNSKGEFVIDEDDKVKRLVGVVDGDFDYYWAYFDGRELSLSTCVSGFIKLKGKIDDKDYNNFIRLAKLNHYDLLLKEHNMCEYKEAMKKELTLQGDNKWIAGPYFEIE